MIRKKSMRILKMLYWIKHSWITRMRNRNNQMTKSKIGDFKTLEKSLRRMKTGKMKMNAPIKAISKLKNKSKPRRQQKEKLNIKPTNQK